MISLTWTSIFSKNQESRLQYSKFFYLMASNLCVEKMKASLVFYGQQFVLKWKNMSWVFLFIALGSRKRHFQIFSNYLIYIFPVFPFSHDPYDHHPSHLGQCESQSSIQGVKWGTESPFEFWLCWITIRSKVLLMPLFIASTICKQIFLILLEIWRNLHPSVSLLNMGYKRWKQRNTENSSYLMPSSGCPVFFGCPDLITWGRGVFWNLHPSKIDCMHLLYFVKST